ncbi:heme-binding protein [Conexibacter sp. DBS9H8]|uniref:GlcG/HbpS family heme-binding protein n=1 Tax=Conexibacter sp. DBS9H8 TaxID=2937801 RepID=UPI00200DB4A4|nr:heme-binding protein [Conexibacter sp. DBS9H8]
MCLTLATARQITAAALAHGTAHGLKPLTVVILDSGGHIRSVEREDGASNQRVQVAWGKANAALALGMGSRALMARAEVQAYFITSVAAAVTGPFVPVPGGVLLRDGAGGAILGAVGVSGDSSDNDEAAAVAGAGAAGLTAQVD